MFIVCTISTEFAEFQPVTNTAEFFKVINENSPGKVSIEYKRNEAVKATVKVSIHLRSSLHSNKILESWTVAARIRIVGVGNPVDRWWRIVGSSDSQGKFFDLMVGVVIMLKESDSVIQWSFI